MKRLVVGSRVGGGETERFRGRTHHVENGYRIHFDNPDTVADRFRIVIAARTLEEGKFDLAFLDDRLALPDRCGVYEGRDGEPL